MNQDKYPPHPYAEVFPMLKGAAFEKMRDDIREKGLLFPIVLAQHDNEWCVLDGRNRLRACLEAERKPRFDYYDGSDPMGYVVSANLQRRDLSTWERASAADALAQLAHGQTRAALGADLLTQAQAAEKCGTSERSTQQARHVKEDGAPELIEALDAREISLKEADEIAKLEKEQQAEAIQERKQRERKAPFDPKVTKACSLDDEALDGLIALFKYGQGSPSERVRKGAETLARMAPGVKQ